MFMYESAVPVLWIRKQGKNHLSLVKTMSVSIQLNKKILCVSDTPNFILDHSCLHRTEHSAENHMGSLWSQFPQLLISRTQNCGCHWLRHHSVHVWSILREGFCHETLEGPVCHNGRWYSWLVDEMEDWSLQHALRNDSSICLSCHKEIQHSQRWQPWKSIFYQNIPHSHFVLRVGNWWLCSFFFPLSKSVGMFGNTFICGICSGKCQKFLTAKWFDLYQIKLIIYFQITSYILLRNVSGILRTRFSTFFAWFGQFWVELLVGQYHVWMGADGHGVLVLVPAYPVSIEFDNRFTKKYINRSFHFKKPCI